MSQVTESGMLTLSTAAGDTSTGRRSAREKIFPGLGQSNVQHTEFQHSGRQKVGYLQRRRPEHKQTEQSQPRIYGITTFIMGKHLYTGTSFGLIADGSSQLLQLYHDGVNLGDRNPELSLPVNKINRIVYCASSLKIRLDMCKSGKYPHVVLIEFKDERNRSSLHRDLTSRASCISLLKERYCL